MKLSARARRAATTVLLTAAVAGTGLAMTPTPAQASWFEACTGSSGATIRDCYHPVQWPSTNCRPVVVVPANTKVRIVCQREGQNISGNPVWDYIVWEGGAGRPEGLAADVNILTGHANWIPGVDRCR